MKVFRTNLAQALGGRGFLLAALGTVLALMSAKGDGNPHAHILLTVAKLEEQLAMWKQYERYKAAHKQYANLKPSKRTSFEQDHHAELALFEAAARYLENLKSSGEPITPKKWQAEVDKLTAQKDSQYRDMRAMREEIKSVERLRKAAEQLSKAEPSRNEPEH